LHVALRLPRRPFPAALNRRAGVALYDVVFALNLAGSLAYGLMVYENVRMTLAPPDALCLFFLRGAGRINDALRLSRVSAFWTASFDGNIPNNGEQLGRELVLLAYVFAATTIVYFLLKIVAGSHLHRVITTRLLGPSLLFAAPLSYLFVMHDPSGVFLFTGEPFFWGISYWPLVLVLGVECVVAIVVARAGSIRSVPRWLLGALWLLHFAFWAPVLWSTLPPGDGHFGPPWGDYFGSYFGVFAPRALLIGWVLLAIIWALRLRRSEPTALEAGVRGRAWNLLLGAVAAAMCLFLWLPRPVRSVIHPVHRDSVMVELSRAPCYGLCSSYSVRVHGNGSVEYTGERREERDRPPAAVSTEQVTTILHKLESIGFFGIEESAFEWCFDTPRIAVLVAVDGVTHRVSSDAWCSGAESSTQARFVQVANEIDQIIGPKNAQGLYPGGATRAR
jgi:hypothetical protein